MGKYSSPSYID
ncbi:hypothetical protein RDI58_028712 [Solanum bulbocastanum]|uniref:Uncharacterized protein n=1 Tax=Solanum bulbocastanum TaxID=147425 RepID=A0AAN8SPD4_SOLBU